ncbi:MAG: amino acid ABC transporter substrate-binding protein [Oscillatoriales cyanobacterium SM2_2_1]|nr:amino acid ABC transporter substrate-binding protein [Oscillatoriales cyanobacterium SM2_2_1]
MTAKLFFFSLGLLSTLSFSPLTLRANPADTSLANVTRRGSLRVAIDAEIGAPYVFWNPETKRYDGFEWELARELATRLKVEARPTPIPWASQPNSLRSRQVDIILNLREEGSLDANFSSSQPYYRTSQRLLVRRGESPINTLRDLIGKRVGVIETSGGAAVLETFNKNRGNAIRLFASRDLDRMLAQLRNRQLDALMLDEPIATWYARDRTFAITGQPLLPIALVVVVNQEDATLLKAVNQAILDMRREGRLEQILKRWNLWQNQTRLKAHPN